MQAEMKRMKLGASGSIIKQISLFNKTCGAVELKNELIRTSIFSINKIQHSYDVEGQFDVSMSNFRHQQHIRTILRNRI